MSDEDVKRERLLQIARAKRSAREGTEREPASSCVDNLEIRPKRAGGGQWNWGKLHIPCPLPTKTEFTKLARANRMTQAELGLIVVIAAMKGRWLKAAIEAHRKAENEGSQESS